LVEWILSRVSNVIDSMEDVPTIDTINCVDSTIIILASFNTRSNRYKETGWRFGVAFILEINSGKFIHGKHLCELDEIEMRIHTLL